MANKRDEMPWELVAWDFPRSVDPLQALFMTAIGKGFRPPIKLIFRDSKGKDFMQLFELGPGGEVLNYSEPKLQNSLEDLDPVPPFSRYRLEDSTRSRRAEVLTDPYLIE